MRAKFEVNADTFWKAFCDLSNEHSNYYKYHSVASPSGRPCGLTIQPGRAEWVTSKNNRLVLEFQAVMSEDGERLVLHHCTIEYIGRRHGFKPEWKEYCREGTLVEYQTSEPHWSPFDTLDSFEGNWAQFENLAESIGQ